MMQEKTMVSDTLAGINGELVRFGEMIPQTENKELKSALKQMRTACGAVPGAALPESQGISPIMYRPSKASQEEIDHVKGLFTSGTL